MSGFKHELDLERFSAFMHKDDRAFLPRREILFGQISDKCHNIQFMNFIDHKIHSM